MRITLSVLACMLVGCLSNKSPVQPEILEFGCDGQPYPSADMSPYVIPFPPGTVVPIGLSNCSSSFHGPGRPDQYATDFDLPYGVPFTAARGGTVSFVDEDEPSLGGGVGNYVIVDHGDGTSALYLHSPADGIFVEPGDTVVQGDTLGVVGQSGLAGYPHLHFIVVKGSIEFPYDGIPVAFRNANPNHVPLHSYSAYAVTEY